MQKTIELDSEAVLYAMEQLHIEAKKMQETVEKCLYTLDSPRELTQEQVDRTYRAALVMQEELPVIFRELGLFQEAYKLNDSDKR